MIDNYSFGRIVIDGQEYNKDVIFFEDEPIELHWLRAQGHLLQYRDLKPYLKKHSPERLIIGQGYYGRMEIKKGLLDKLKEKGFAVEKGKSPDMVNKYNSESKHKLMACFHLTC